MKKSLILFILILRVFHAHAGQIFAVVVGENHYQDANMSPLRYCEADASAFAQFLASPQAGAVPSENTLLLTGENATRGKVLNGVAEYLKNRVGADDMVVFFFSGHGSRGAGGGYLMPYEGKENDPVGTGIPMEQLYAIINSSPAKLKTVYIDACHAGQYGQHPGLKGSAAEMNQEFSLAYKEVIERTKPGTLNVLSSRGSEKSQESEELKSGLFTYYLIKGLAGAADKKPSDGKVTAGELDEYLSQKVSDASNFQQHPEISKGMDPSFPLSIVNLKLMLTELIRLQPTSASSSPAAVPISLKPADEPLSKGFYFSPDVAGGTCFGKATFINNLGFPVSFYKLADNNGEHEQSDYLSNGDQIGTGKLVIKRFITAEQAAEQFFDCTFYFKATINGVTKYAAVKKTIQSCYNQYFVLTPRNVQFGDREY